MPSTASRRRSARTSPRRSSRRACARATSLRITKLVTYHTSTGVPAEELADRCHRTLDRAVDDGPTTIFAEQREWLDAFWDGSDVELHGDEPGQQAMRWNLFQLAQASAQTQEHGIAAKGVTGGGYEGHYFWDTETYVVPFLAYTSPELARKVLRFRWRQLPQARQRAGRAEPGRRAVPVAHDHRRGGVGLLRRRHRAVPHQRGDRLRPQALPRRQRRHRLPRRRGGRDPRRDGAAVGGPRLLRHERRGGLPHPRRDRTRTSTRPSSTTTSTRTSWPASTCATRRASSSRCGSGTATPTTRCAAASGSTRPRSSGGSGRPTRCTCRTTSELGINPQDDTFLELEPWDFANTPADQLPAAAALPPARDLPPPGAQAGRRRAGDGPAQRPVPARPEAPQLRLLRPDHDGRLVAVGVRAGDGGGPDRLRRARRRLLPRGAVRRSRRHPRQRQRRRARGVVRRRRGARSCSASPACSTPAPRCASRRACPSRVGGRVVPDATTWLEAARRARRRRLHGDVLDGHPGADRGRAPRCRRARRCRESHRIPASPSADRSRPPARRCYRSSGTT